MSDTGKRLVNRVIRLHVEKAMTCFMPSSAAGVSLAASNAERTKLDKRAAQAKAELLAYMASLSALPAPGEET